MDRIVPVEGYIKETGTEKGRGVFAGRNFCKGEIIEIAPVIVMRRPFKSVPPVLQMVVFNWGVLAKLPRPASAVVLGYGSMYNHANPANMRYFANPEDETMHYVAVTDVAKDEELTVNYNAGDSEVSVADVWFKRRNIEPI